ncbi:response regulator [Hoeflea prorocentri]|uniref:Response regulator n=1 Tax=Hoeflea prorocentri TaxID=1922333 RepID=A0A9X3ZGT2_9HYPH|nr:response regulator [Hoeflea prorocentri]MCY6380070.1 response regulator [Hoeflea prorocentri]MDA5397870.1 response regulator [Hoeflea prorocentri]
MNEALSTSAGKGAQTADAARILVVDDNSLSRKKMRMAVESLGHSADVAKNGLEALEALKSQAFDAVLLDIVMPEMDGFDVLAAMKADERMRDVPVIVISALDDETESVVKAIELGAEDFLPKNFDPVLLRARVESSLSKKRFRDQELEYFGRIERLTEAAEVLESGRFNPESLELDELANKDDPLGRLAAVFRGMAGEIYERELKLKRAIHTLQGAFLVIAVGLVWGLTPALSRMASGLGSNPLGLAIWVNGIAAVFCLGIAAYRGKLPRLNCSQFMFFVYWAIIAGILQRMTTFVVTEHVEAAMLSLIVTLQGFMVFAFAAVTRMEKATPRRLVGLLVGLIGVSLVLLTRFDMSNGAQSAWLLFAMLLPLLFAVEALVLAGKRPEHVDIFASVGLMMGLSACMLAPWAYFSGDLMPLGPQIGQLEVLVVLMGIVGAGSLLLAFHLIATAGAVFYSQSAYTMTIAGVVWGMLLLNEELSALAWIAFAIIAIGMYLVEPKASDEELVIKRSFNARD